MPSLIAPEIAAGRMVAMGQPVLVSDGLSLRPWTASDRAAVVAGYADPAIQRWHCRTMTDDEADAWIAAWVPRWQNETGAGWAIVAPSVGAHALVVGQIALRQIVLSAGWAEVSYWVRPEARGRRIAPRALAGLAAWASGPLGLHRIELNHSTANPASCRVAEVAGFAAEGTRRAAVRHADGWHDMHQHARLATDPPTTVL